jgi:co-chaperonin GroES (HSP10)
VLIDKWGGVELADAEGEYLVHEAAELLAVVS